MRCWVGLLLVALVEGSAEDEEGEGRISKTDSTPKWSENEQSMLGTRSVMTTEKSCRSFDRVVDADAVYASAAFSSDELDAQAHGRGCNLTSYPHHAYSFIQRLPCRPSVEGESHVTPSSSIARCGSGLPPCVDDNAPSTASNEVACSGKPRMRIQKAVIQPSDMPQQSNRQRRWSGIQISHANHMSSSLRTIPRIRRQLIRLRDPMRPLVLRPILSTRCYEMRIPDIDQSQSRMVDRNASTSFPYKPVPLSHIDRLTIERVRMRFCLDDIPP